MQTTVCKIERRKTFVNLYQTTENGNGLYLIECKMRRDTTQQASKIHTHTNLTMQYMNLVVVMVLYAAGTIYFHNNFAIIVFSFPII